MSVPVLAIVGHSNSGKTTLMEKLIARLTASGLRVGSIKHSHHQPEMDTPGKDSWRHKQAGAATSLLVGPERMLMVADLDAAPTPRRLSELFFAGHDLILVEGYASIPGAKIEVVRGVRSPGLICSPDELIAVATDVPGLIATVPCFGLDDVPAIMSHILDWMHRERT